MKNYGMAELMDMDNNQLYKLQNAITKELEKYNAKLLKTELEAAKSTEWHRTIKNEIESYYEHGCYPGYDLEYTHADEKKALKRAEKFKVATIELKHSVEFYNNLYETIEHVLQKKYEWEHRDDEIDLSDYDWINDPDHDINVFIDDRK